MACHDFTQHAVAKMLKRVDKLAFGVCGPGIRAVQDFRQKASYFADKLHSNKILWPMVMH